MHDIGVKLNLHIIILMHWQAEETLTNTGVWLQIIQGKGVSKQMPSVRVELTTFRLWDWRAAYCANEAHSSTYVHHWSSYNLFFKVE